MFTSCSRRRLTTKDAVKYSFLKANSRKQLSNEALVRFYLTYIVSDVSCHGEGCAVADGEGYVETPGDSLGQEGLPRTRRTEHHDIRLLQTHVVCLGVKDIASLKRKESV